MVLLREAKSMYVCIHEYVMHMLYVSTRIAEGNRIKSISRVGHVLGGPGMALLPPLTTAGWEHIASRKYQPPYTTTLPSPAPEHVHHVAAAPSPAPRHPPWPSSHRPLTTTHPCHH